MPVTIKEVYQQAKELSELKKIIKVGGWVKSHRKGKEKNFIALNDGSTINNLQIVISRKNFSQLNLLEKINFGSGLLVSGCLILTPERQQSCELEVEKVELVNSADSNYPLQKKNIPLEVVRSFPHLRAKTNYFLAIFHLRHSVSQAIHEFFHQEGFYYLPTPIITSSDAEGAGELFTIQTKKKNFFDKEAKLTVSGQLQAESLVQGLGKVYTFSPCFRAEQSNTTRHLAEFWMVEPEMVFADLKIITILAEKMVKWVMNFVLVNNYLALEHLEKHNQRKLTHELRRLTEENWEKVDYDKCIEILVKNKENFVFCDIKWGMDLQSEHEKYLCQYFNNKPVFVVNYPQELKAFYMKNNSDGRTVACFDLIFPRVGELIGGSMREDNYQILIEKAKKIGLDIENLTWYFDLRKYGYAPSGGFGLGLERLIMFITGTENIRDTIAFPRYFKNSSF
jgi:asparaginyl-tRNA synthetase